MQINIHNKIEPWFVNCVSIITNLIELTDEKILVVDSKISSYIRCSLNFTPNEIKLPVYNLNDLGGRKITFVGVYKSSSTGLVINIYEKECDENSFVSYIRNCNGKILFEFLNVDEIKINTDYEKVFK